MEEIWKEIEVPGYYISNLGRIRGRSGKIIHSHKTTSGYNAISIRPAGRKNPSRYLKIARLIAKAFIPNPNNYPIVNHIDGNKQNDAISNLEWCTQSYNIKHAYRTGLAHAKCGVDNDSAKLSEEDVKYIRTNYIPRDKEFGTRALGRKFNVSHHVIMYILNNKTYKNMK